MLSIFIPNNVEIPLDVCPPVILHLYFQEYSGRLLGVDIVTRIYTILQLALNVFEPS